MIGGDEESKKAKNKEREKVVGMADCPIIPISCPHMGCYEGCRTGHPDVEGQTGGSCCVGFFHSPSYPSCPSGHIAIGKKWGGLVIDALTSHLVHHTIIQICIA